MFLSLLCEYCQERPSSSSSTSRSSSINVPHWLTPPITKGLATPRIVLGASSVRVFVMLRLISDDRPFREGDEFRCVGILDLDTGALSTFNANVDDKRWVDLKVPRSKIDETRLNR